MKTVDDVLRLLVFNEINYQFSVIMISLVDSNFLCYYFAI